MLSPIQIQTLDNEDLYRVLNALANDPCLLPLFGQRVADRLKRDNAFDFEAYEVSENGMRLLKSLRAA